MLSRSYPDLPDNIPIGARFTAFAFSFCMCKHSNKYCESLIFLLILFDYFKLTVLSLFAKVLDTNTLNFKLIFVRIYCLCSVCILPVLSVFCLYKKYIEVNLKYKKM